MSLYSLRHYPDPILKIPTKVENYEKDWQLALFEIMKRIGNHHSALGLAAPQIGLSYRAFVAWLDEDQILFCLNPDLEEIQTGTEEKVISLENCLSLPDLAPIPVERSSRVCLTYTDLNGDQIKEEYTGQKAIILQHEFDHLNGKLIIDYLTPKDKFDILSFYQGIG